MASSRDGASPTGNVSVGGQPQRSFGRRAVGCGLDHQLFAEGVGMNTATEAVSGWLSAFGAALERGDVDAAAGMFADESYWRDLVSFTWNITTLEGRAEITEMLRAQL